MKAGKKTFVAVFYIVFLYMYVGTVANYIGYSYVIFRILNQRAIILAALCFLGIMYVCMFNDMKIHICQSDKAALFLTGYMLFRGISHGGSTLGWFSCVALWCIMMLISSNMSLRKDELEFYSLSCTIAGILMCILYISGSMNSVFEASVEGSNSIYYIMCTLPCMLMCRNKFVKYMGLLFLIIAVLFSGKGTCIVALLVVGVYMISCFKDNIRENKNHIFAGIGIIILIIFIANMWIKKYMPEETILSIIMSTFDEANSGGNGRTEIYRRIFIELKESDLVHLFVGHGFGSVSQYINIGSHNDFLMVLFDYGIIGFLFYIYFWICLIKKVKYIHKWTKNRTAYVCSLIIFAAVSMFSNVLNSQIQFLILCVFWGIMNSDCTIEMKYTLEETYE